MSEATATESDLLTSLRREIDRNALRARNGIKYLAGGRFVRSGATPRDLIWSHGKAQLWRYRSEHPRTRKQAILMYVGLVGRAYAFDLYPKSSFVTKLMEAGFDAFVLDWGVPDEKEAQNTIANYAIDMLPDAVNAAYEVARAEGEDFTILGYCMGGCLTIAALGSGIKLPMSSLVLMATPTDYSKMGEFFTPILNGDFDIDNAIDETGNVPASYVRSSFRVRKPTADLVVYANLWENLWNDSYMEAFQAMNEWVTDQVPFPGAAFKDFAQNWLIPNGLVNKTLRIRNKKVDLGRIKVPTLVLIAEKDDIVPLASADALPGLLTKAKPLEIVRLPAGHVNLVTGRLADKVTIPSIIRFLDEYGKGRTR